MNTRALIMVGLLAAVAVAATSCRKKETAPSSHATAPAGARGDDRHAAADKGAPVATAAATTAAPVATDPAVPAAHGVESGAKTTDASIPSVGVAAQDVASKPKPVAHPVPAAGGTVSHSAVLKGTSSVRKDGAMVPLSAASRSERAP